MTSTPLTPCLGFSPRVQCGTSGQTGSTGTQVSTSGPMGVSGDPRTHGKGGTLLQSLWGTGPRLQDGGRNHGLFGLFTAPTGLSVAGPASQGHVWTPWTRRPPPSLHPLPPSLRVTLRLRRHPSLYECVTHPGCPLDRPRTPTPEGDRTGGSGPGRRV